MTFIIYVLVYDKKVKEKKKKKQCVSGLKTDEMLNT